LIPRLLLYNILRYRILLFCYFSIYTYTRYHVQGVRN